MAMSDAKFIEACIPDSLRLAEHQDAALVNEAIATALLAYRKAMRDNVWEKNIASDIAKAMTAYMESAYVPHISKENEDWSKLQLEAEEARVMKAAQAEVEAHGPTPFDITMTAFSNVTDRASLTAAHEQYLNKRSSFTPSQKVDASDAWRDARDMIEAREDEAERLKDIELGGEAMREEWERNDRDRYAARAADVLTSTEKKPSEDKRPEYDARTATMVVGDIPEPYKIAEWVKGKRVEALYPDSPSAGHFAATARVIEGVPLWETDNGGLMLPDGSVAAYRRYKTQGSNESGWFSYDHRPGHSGETINEFPMRNRSEAVQAMKRYARGEFDW
jgi:hypothetical protein